MSANKRIWTSQPQYLARLSQAFADANVWNCLSLDLRDTKTGILAARMGSTHVVDPGAGGRGVHLTGRTATNNWDTNIAGVSGNNPRTVFALFNLDSSTYNGVIQTGVQSSGTDFSIVNGAGAGAANDIRFNLWGIASIDVPFGTYRQGSVVAAAITYDGSTVRTSVNGTAYGTYTGAVNTTAGNVIIGSANAQSACIVPIYLAGSVPRAFNQVQLNQLTTNPWQLFAPRKRRLFAVAAGGAVSGTLASTLGAITAALSGTTAIVGSISSALANTTAAINGTVTDPGALNASLGNVTGNISGSTSTTGVLASTLDAIVGAITGTTTVVGSMASTLADVVGAFYQTITTTLADWFHIKRRRR
jgi:hypothetical protein